MILTTALQNDPPIPAEVFPKPGGEYEHGVCARKIFPVIAKQRNMFNREQTVVEVVRDSRGDFVIRDVTPSRFVAVIGSYGHRIAIHERIRVDGEIIEKWRTGTFSEQAARVLIVTDAAREHLPPLRQVLGCPVAVRDGQKIRVLGKGWHEHEGGTLVTKGRVDESVPLEIARKSLLDLLCDFRFQSEGDRSRAIAGMISPAMKFGGWIPDDFPLDFSEANKSQSGKNYRFRLLGALYSCEMVSITVENTGRGVGSLDEKISHALIGGRPFVSIQNVRGRVESQIFEEAIRGGGRVTCRASRTQNVDVDTDPFLWLLSTNGAEMTVDLANRSIITRIEKQAEDFAFREYEEGNLILHVAKRREFYLGCVFAILREYALRGCPTTSERRHDFRGWVQVMDYIVQEIFGAAPLLDGHQSEQIRVGSPELQWLREVARCVVDADLEGQQLTTAAFIEHAEDSGVEFPRSIPARGDEATYTRAGRCLKKCFQNSTESSNGIAVVEVGEYLVRRHVQVEYNPKERKDEPVRKYEAWKRDCANAARDQ